GPRGPGLPRPRLEISKELPMGRLTKNSGRTLRQWLGGSAPARRLPRLQPQVEPPDARVLLALPVGSGPPHPVPIPPPPAGPLDAITFRNPASGTVTIDASLWPGSHYIAVVAETPGALGVGVDGKEESFPLNGLRHLSIIS